MIFIRIHIIACQVFSRELNYFSSRSKNIIDITYLPQGLHDTPDILRQKLVSEIKRINTEAAEKFPKNPPDVIALCYGLCSNGIAGIESDEIPIVVPRTDDCIGIFLGSQKRYLSLFKKHNGTYWLNNGWIENAFIPSKDKLEKQYSEYLREYGDDNAEFLMEQTTEWLKKYNCCGYITSEVYENAEYHETARNIAVLHNWEYSQHEGDSRLIKKMLDGDFDEEFLFCPPHNKIEESFDEKKIKAIPS